MKQLLKTVTLFTCLIFFFSCNFATKNTGSDNGFYSNHSDWDLIWIPIMDPVRAYQLNSDEWQIDPPAEFMHVSESVMLGSIPVYAFGVTNNFIYGYSKFEWSSIPKKWFLYNPKALIYNEYSTKEQWLQVLKTLNIEIKPIKPCEEYYKSLVDGKRCYWYPPKGEVYPNYKPAIPNNATVIEVTGDQNGIDFQVQKVRKNLPNIYYFKMKYNNADNDLFYVSINHSSPKLITDNLIITTCPWSNYFDIAVYTPYPVGQAKGIKKEDRLVLSKTIYLEEE